MVLPGFTSRNLGTDGKTRPFYLGSPVVVARQLMVLSLKTHPFYL